MFQLLVESRAVRPRRASWTAVSFIAHSAVIAGAIVLTATAAPDATRADPIEDIIYVAPPPVPQPAPSTTPGAIAPMEVPRPIFSFPVLVSPPITTPGPDFFNRVLDDLSRMTTGTVTGGNPGTGVPPGGVYTAEGVDHMVVPSRDNASPAYPSRLASAGIEGDVSVRFVVDSTGRVEASSVEILQASHAQFGDAVKHWVKQTRYAPARVNGQAVRQLVQQRVGFTLTR